MLFAARAGCPSPSGGCGGSREAAAGLCRELAGTGSGCGLPRGLPFPPPESARDAGGAAASGQGKTWTPGRCNLRFGRFPFPKGECLRSYFTLRSWEGNVWIMVIRPFLSGKALGLQV